VQAGEESASRSAGRHSFRAAPERLRMRTLWRRSNHSGPMDRSLKPMRNVPRSVALVLTLKALAHWKNWRIIAAGTTSLPEKLHGSRQLGLSILLAARRHVYVYALVGSDSFPRQAWREWLLRG